MQARPGPRAASQLVASSADFDTGRIGLTGPKAGDGFFLKGRVQGRVDIMCASLGRCGVGYRFLEVAFHWAVFPRDVAIASRAELKAASPTCRRLAIAG